jgi:hypothetical protein
VDVPHATPDGLYIQVFEPALNSRIPLRSVYHPASRTVTAAAPHLSLFGVLERRCMRRDLPDGRLH